MNNQLDQIKKTILEYRKVLLPLLLIVAAVLIVFVVILPQISSIIQKTKIISGQNDLIAVLKNSQKTVSDASLDQVDADYQTTTHALPVQKDIGLIFDALTRAASNSNTTLDSFAITVGGIYGKSIQPGDLTGIPSMKVTANVGGDVADLVTFTKILNETLPLSEITKINVSNNEAVLDINFFFKAVDSSKIARQNDVVPLSQTDKNTLNRLKDWEK